jgi:hypothetical protein
MEIIENEEYPAHIIIGLGRNNIVA